jgi:predicted Fe-Mo cluster-binding NifX family protein
MRVAISVEDSNGLNSRISHHFGRCPYFALVDLDGNDVQEVMIIDNPYYARHEPGMVPAFIREQGAQVMISGGMGRRAIAFFSEYGIQAATGAAGTVKLALDSYLRGELQGAAPCHESGHGHGDGEMHGCEGEGH